MVGEFHDFKANCDLWVQQQVKSNCAWELDEEDSEGVRELVGLVFLVNVHTVAHATKHSEDNTLNTNGSVKHLSSLLWVDQELLLILLQIGEKADHTDVGMLLLDLKDILVCDVVFESLLGSALCSVQDLVFQGLLLLRLGHFLLLSSFVLATASIVTLVEGVAVSMSEWIMLRGLLRLVNDVGYVFQKSVLKNRLEVELEDHPEGLEEDLDHDGMGPEFAELVLTSHGVRSVVDVVDPGTHSEIKDGENAESQLALVHICVQNGQTAESKEVDGLHDHINAHNCF